jgi:hypothetical protein
MSRIVITAVFWAFMMLPVQAEVPENIVELADSLGLTEVIDVMQEEGISYGDEMAAEMFPGQAGPRWHDIVEVIYDQQVMRDVALEGLAKGLQGTDTAPLLAFFSGDLGKRIIRLEISARQALMDETIEDASKENVVQMVKEDDPRLALIAEFILTNSLLESNVVGAMNANYAFYTGLQQGGAFPQPLTEDQILTDVWSQEQEIRDDTSEWLYAYLTMAYQPLSNEDLQKYIDISRRDDGKALNQALFDGFDQMFVGIARALGVAAAQMMMGQDL